MASNYDPSRIKATWADSLEGLEDTFRKMGVSQWMVRPLRPAKTTTREAARVKVTYQDGGRDVTLSLADHWEERHNLWIIWQGIESVRLNRVRGLEKVVESAMLQLQEVNTDFVVLLRDADDLNEAYRREARRLSADAEGLKQLNIARDAVLAMRND